MIPAVTARGMFSKKATAAPSTSEDAPSNPQSPADAQIGMTCPVLSRAVSNLSVQRELMPQLDVLDMPAKCSEFRQSVVNHRGAVATSAWNSMPPIFRGDVSDRRDPVRSLDKMSTRCSGLKPVGEILRFVGHQSFAEFHDAHRVGWYAVVGKYEFGDPEFAAADNSPEG